MIEQNTMRRAARSHQFLRIFGGGALHSRLSAFLYLKAEPGIPTPNLADSR